VDTDVSPEEALVYLDGQLIGTADDFDGYPDYLYLEPGVYKLELRLQGYESKTVEIRAKRAAQYNLDFKLTKVPGEKAAPWWERPANLPVGRVFGPAGKGAHGAGTGADLRLRPETSGSEPPAGEDAEPEDGVPEAGAVGPSQESGQPSQPQGEGTPPAVSGRPAPRANAALDLRVSPGRAAVYLDGELVGTGDEMSRLERGLAVTPGTHKLEVFAPGKAARTVEVEVKAGERQQVVIELEQGT
jgi:hypothetical protein